MTTDFNKLASLTTKQAAEFLGVTSRLLVDRRRTGDGPQFMAIASNLVRYRLEDLIAWQEARLCADTLESPYGRRGR